MFDKQFAESDFGWWCQSLKRVLVASDRDVQVVPGRGPVRWSEPRRCFGCGVAHHRREGCNPEAKAAYEAAQKAIEAEQDAEREREILAVLALPNEDWLDGFGELSSRVKRISDPRIKAQLATATAAGAARRNEVRIERDRFSTECRIAQPLREAIVKHQRLVAMADAHAAVTAEFWDIDESESDESESEPVSENRIEAAAEAVRVAYAEYQRAMAALGAGTAAATSVNNELAGAINR